jgi:hypothetical protein
LLAALQIPGVARSHVHALKVVDEDLLEILPAIDDGSWKMIQSGSTKISQIDQEELDDEDIIIHAARPAHEAVILQLDTGVSFAVVLDDIASRSKTHWETNVGHDTSKCLRAKPFRTEVALFMIIVSCASLGLCIVIPWTVLLVHLRFRPSAWSAQPIMG